MPDSKMIIRGSGIRMSWVDMTACLCLYKVPLILKLPFSGLFVVRVFGAVWEFEGGV